MDKLDSLPSPANGDSSLKNVIHTSDYLNIQLAHVQISDRLNQKNDIEVSDLNKKLRQVEYENKAEVTKVYT